MDFISFKQSFPMQTCKIAKVNEENYRIKTLELSAGARAFPGQFIMIWQPGIGERPMSLGSDSPLSVTIANVGKFSSAIHALKAGDLFSFRGPLGKPFSLGKLKTGNKILLVGGGYGVVPLCFLAKEARKLGIECTAVIGARKKEDVIYLNHFREAGAHVEVTTDDGSLGTTGNAIHGVHKLLDAGRKFDAAYSCGPERMMHALAKICQEKKIPCEVSIERYMKCGINICGACAIDGKICCRDGPIFQAKQALRFRDFGSITRDASGKRSSLH